MWWDREKQKKKRGNYAKRIEVIGCDMLPKLFLRLGIYVFFNKRLKSTSSASFSCVKFVSLLSLPPFPPAFSFVFSLLYLLFIMQIWQLNEGENPHAVKFADSLISTSDSFKNGLLNKRHTWVKFSKELRWKKRLCAMCVWTNFWCICTPSSWIIQHTLLRLWQFRCSLYMSKHWYNIETQASLQNFQDTFQMYDESSGSYTLHAANNV